MEQYTKRSGGSMPARLWRMKEWRNALSSLKDWLLKLQLIWWRQLQRYPDFRTMLKLVLPHRLQPPHWILRRKKQNILLLMLRDLKSFMLFPSKNNKLPRLISQKKTMSLKKTRMSWLSSLSSTLSPLVQVHPKKLPLKMINMSSDKKKEWKKPAKKRNVSRW